MSDVNCKTAAVLNVLNVPYSANTRVDGNRISTSVPWPGVEEMVNCARFASVIALVRGRPRAGSIAPFTTQGIELPEWLHGPVRYRPCDMPIPVSRTRIATAPVGS